MFSHPLPLGIHSVPKFNLYVFFLYPLFLLALVNHSKCSPIHFVKPMIVCSNCSCMQNFTWFEKYFLLWSLLIRYFSVCLFFMIMTVSMLISGSWLRLTLLGLAISFLYQLLGFAYQSLIFIISHIYEHNFKIDLITYAKVIGPFLLNYLLCDCALYPWLWSCSLSFYHACPLFGIHVFFFFGLHTLFFLCR